MGTQYNPNPNGASSTGWSLTNVTRSDTGDGARLRKTVTGMGGATLQFAVPGSGRLTLAGLQITRNSDDPLPEVLYFGRNSGVSESFVQMSDGWGGKGVRFTMPPVSTPSSTSGSAYITISSSGKFDITVRHLYVYAYGDSAVPGLTPDLDAGDASWSVAVPDDDLTVVATWAGAPDEYVDALEWKASSGATPQLLDASLTPNHKRTWTYTGAGTVTASLTVRNFSGDSYRLDKTFSVPSGTYAANFAYETDYLHVEVDASSSVGAVIERYSWDWGDGTSTLNQTVPYASHTYALPGSYVVTVTISNSMGQSSSRALSVLAQTVPTTPVNFTVEQDRLAVIFTSLTEGVAYGWDFGDGGVASTAQAAHTYATSGTYVVVLTVDGVSASQSVTVTDDYVPLDLVQSMRLEVRQNPGDIVPWNRLANPSGALGASGWTTPATAQAYIKAGPQGLTLVAGGDVGVLAVAGTVRVPVLPGRYVTGSFELVSIDAPCYVRAQIGFTDETGVDVGSTPITAYQNAPGTYWTGPTKVPSTARYADMWLTLSGSASATVPPAGAELTWRHAMIASSLYASQVTNPPYSEAGAWADVLGPTHEIDIVRGELDVSTLTATVLDAQLDPAVSDTITPGAEVRLRVATDRDGNRVWQPVYTGQLVEASVQYRDSTMLPAREVSTDLALNPTLTASTNTYELIDTSRMALAATVDGGKFTLTGYGTSNTYYFGALLKIPTRPDRAYRVRIRARRVSGYADGLVFRVRAFDSTDTDLGEVGIDRTGPTVGGVNISWASLCSSTAGEWVDNEYLIPAGRLPAAASTINLWFTPQGNGTTSPNGEYTITNVHVLEEWTPPALPARRKSSRITMLANDATQTLSQITEPRGVAQLQQLPALLETSGVPFTVDGVGNTGPDPVVAAMNDNASLLDQVVAARDTQLGYAHVSRAGVLTLLTPQAVSTLPAATLDESTYTNPDVEFSTAQVINSVLIKWLRWDPSAGEAGETVETQYGPYEDLVSVDKWQRRRETFTWQGQVENVPAIEAQAQELLAANSTPIRRANSVVLPIRYASDLSPSRALLDLMDLVRVRHERTGLDVMLRITELHHRIVARNGRTPAKWTVEVGFGQDGTVARPMPIPAPSPAKGGATPGDWTPLPLAASWVDYTPSGVGWRRAEYRVNPITGEVRLRGFIKTTIARGSGSHLITTLSDNKPDGSEMFCQEGQVTNVTAGASAGTAHTHTTAVQTGIRVDVETDGEVRLQCVANQYMAVNGWLSLSGIVWEK